MKISADLQISITVALSEAERMGHEYAGLEHLLYALTFDDDTAEVLKHAGADLTSVRETLTEYLSEELESTAHGGQPPRLTLGVQRVLSMAAARVGSSGRDEINGPDVLVALYDEADSYAIQVLEGAGVGRLDVVSFIAHGVSRIQPPYFGGRDAEGSGMPAGEDDDEDEGARPARRRGGERSAQGLRPGPDRARPQGGDRPADRPRQGDPAHPPHPPAAAEEQPDLRRRSRASARPRWSRGWRCGSPAARSRRRSATPGSTGSTWAR